MKRRDPLAVSVIPDMPKRPIQLIIDAFRPYKWRLGLFCLLSFLGIAAYVASPFVISIIVTELTKNPVLSGAIWFLVIIFFVLRFADEILWRVAEFVMRGIKPNVAESVRVRLFNAVLKRPHGFFVNSSSGRIGHWINQSAQVTNEFNDTTAWTVWPQSMGLLISAGFLLTIHWSVALLFVIWMVGLFLFTIKRGKRFGQLVAEVNDEQSKAAGHVVDALSNHLSVRAFNAGQREHKKLMVAEREIIKRWRRSWLQNLITNMVKGYSAAIMSGIALVIVLILFQNQIVPIGAVVLFIAYFGDASSSLWNLAWALDSYYRNLGTLQNALSGLAGDTERATTHHVSDKDAKKATLDFQNVSFAYAEAGRTHVLRDVSLTVKPGEKVGIVGHSGAGKSTLVNLTLGLYEPTSGDIVFGGTSMKAAGPSLIREHISFVPQDSQLFNRSVRENILYGKPGAKDADITEALKQAEAFEFVTALPDGLDTIIGERGVKLSGGQRQRLAIARAILQNAPLLILDEATSALDSVSEQAIQKALHNLMKSRTALVIAHRLSTLRHLDRIIVLDGGSIAESGTHEQLLDLGGIYADLWRRQKDGFVAE